MLARLFSPHYRLIYAFLFGVMVSGVQNAKCLLELTACVGFLWLLAVFMARDGANALKKWLKFNLFSVLIWLTLTWHITPEGVAFYAQGVQLATLITLRMNLIMFAMWLFLWKINEVTLLQALTKLPLPSKLIYLFVMTVRYIALFKQLQQKMDWAMKARGYQPACNFRTLQLTTTRVALLLVQAMLKAQTAEMALKARAFRFGEKNDTA